MQTNSFDTTEQRAFLPYAPIVLVRDVVKRWLVVLVAVVAVSVAAFILSEETYKPVYQTETTLVITSRDTTVTIFSNLKTTTELASVFSSLLNSSTMQDVVLKDLGMDSVDCEISARAIGETNLMSITVQSHDPRTAFLVLESLIRHHDVVTYEVIGDVVVDVLQTPGVPEKPINVSSSIRNVKVAAILAAIGACAAIAFYSYSSDTVRSRLEAEKKLNCWCLGEIHHEKKHKTLRDWFAREKRGLVIINSDVSFRYAETIRKMRRRVEQYLGDRRVVMVTSVMENEGKTTVAVNLALSLAKKHEKVLLIDLDLRKPACNRLLNQDNDGHGPLDVILGRAELLDCVVTEKISGLDMLLEQSDRKYNPQKITSLVASGRVAKLIAEAKKHYHYVVVDLPPMSAAPDAEYIMEYADASMLVVKQNLVKAKSLNKAIATLEKGESKLLGCVINDVYAGGIPLAGARGYGYGYGYGNYKK